MRYLMAVWDMLEIDTDNKVVFVVKATILGALVVVPLWGKNN